jgi:predicted metal-dependent phosphoesterase TrpH
MEKQAHIDFHTHTFYSDGLQTPEDVIKTARFNGIDYLAITDHDNVRAHRNAYALGQKWGVEIVPGVEVSTDKYHILGLGINTEAETLKEFLALSEKAQKRVCGKRVEGLQRQGIPISLEKVVNYCPESRLGKMNIWYSMVQDPECQEFFKQRGLKTLDYGTYNNYLNKYPEVNDRDTDVFPAEAIKQIHLAGGKAFIAHPFKDVDSMKELDVLVGQGIDGIEIQPNHNGRNEPFRKYAEQHNLLLTYGSDWHGGAFDRTMLTWRGENLLDMRLAEALGIVIE